MFNSGVSSQNRINKSKNSMQSYNIRIYRTNNYLHIVISCILKRYGKRPKSAFQGTAMALKKFGLLVKSFFRPKLTHGVSIEKFLRSAFLGPEKPVFAPGAKMGAFIDSGPIVPIRAGKGPKRAVFETSRRGPLQGVTDSGGRGCISRTGAKVRRDHRHGRQKVRPGTGRKIHGRRRSTGGTDKGARPGAKKGYFDSKLFSLIVHKYIKF